MDTPHLICGPLILPTVHDYRATVPIMGALVECVTLRAPVPIIGALVVGVTIEAPVPMIGALVE